jgi:PAS domain S-box-containing protein
MIRILYIGETAREFTAAKSILLEDDPDLLIEHSANAEDALARLCNGSWDCAICDFQVPQSDGVDFLKRLRAGNVAVPTVFLTSRGSEVLAVEALRNRADGYWDKDSAFKDVKDFLGSIHRLVSSKRRLDEQRQAEAAWEYRLRLEKLISVISTDFIGLRTIDVDSKINQALRTVGEFAGVDRSYIFLFGEDGSRLIRSYLWTRRGLGSPADLLAEVQIRDYPWWMSRLMRFETILLERVDSLPLEACAERDVLTSLGIQSLVFVPMICRGSLYGFLGFDSLTSAGTWKAEDLALLNTVAELFVSALEGKRIDDILGQYKTEQEQIFNTSADGMCLIDRDHTILRANSAFCELAGLSRVETEGSKCYQVLACPYCFTPACILTRILGGEERVELDLFKSRTDGSHVPCIVSATPLRNAKGQLIGMLNHYKNITGRRKAEEEARESERRLRNIFEGANDIIYAHDLDGNFTSVNPAGLRIYGYSEEEVLRLNFDQVVAADHLNVARRKLDELLQGRASEEPFELLTFTKKNNPVWVEVNIRLLVRDGSPVGVLGIGRNITNRKRAEQKLLEYQQQLRSLASELSLAEERQRRRFSIELHDRIGMSLALAKIKLSEIRQEVSENGLERDIKAVLGLIDQSIQGARSLTLDLCPPILHEMGFDAAVEWLAEHVREQYGLEVNYSHNETLKELDDDINAFLYRTLRELLFNVVKHAQATCARIRADIDSQCIRLTVEDDGVGFDSQRIVFRSDGHGGFGLFSIRERLKHLGGEFSINSEPGKGTKVTLVVPLSGEKG